jgi:hypothetical protein
MYSETIKYWDEEAKEIKEIPVKDLDERLKGLIELLKRCIQKLEELGTHPMNYRLQTFEISLSLKAGIFIISTEGAIKLRYEHKS